MLSYLRALKIPILEELAQSDPFVGQNPSFLLALGVGGEVEGGGIEVGGLFGYFTLSYSIPLFLSSGELLMLKECEHTWVGVKKMVVNTAMSYVYVEKMLGGLEARGGKVSVFVGIFMMMIFIFVLFCFVLFCFVLFFSSSPPISPSPPSPPRVLSPALNGPGEPCYGVYLSF